MDPFDMIARNTASARDEVSETRNEPEPTPGYGHAPGNSDARRESFPIARTEIRRDVFWQNVCREILMGLAGAAAESSGRLETGPAAAESSVSPASELFDGRMGVITTLGQRIPIADVVPVFSCSMDAQDGDRSLSNDVQCTIFRLKTPTGETYTLPLSQIAGVHTLSPSLVEKIEDQQSSEKDKQPFGFAAYTSTARSERLAELEHGPESGEPTLAKPDSGQAARDQ